MVVEPQGALKCRSSIIAVWVNSGSFLKLLLSFGGPRVISTNNEPQVCLPVGYQHSQFLSILTRFVEYYSPFWGPKAISVVVEPQGALKCRLSRITVCADSGPFLGL